MKNIMFFSAENVSSGGAARALPDELILHGVVIIMVFLGLVLSWLMDIGVFDAFARFFAQVGETMRNGIERLFGQKNPAIQLKKYEYVDGLGYQVKSMLSAYENIKVKAPVFEDSEDVMKRAYKVICEQIMLNLQAAVKFCKAYNKGSNNSYLKELDEATEILSRQLDTLVEQKIRLEHSVKAYDDEFIDCFLSQLKKLNEADDPMEKSIKE